MKAILVIRSPMDLKRFIHTRRMRRTVLEKSLSSISKPARIHAKPERVAFNSFNLITCLRFKPAEIERRQIGGNG